MVCQNALQRSVSYTHLSEKIENNARDTNMATQDQKEAVFTIKMCIRDSVSAASKCFFALS